jgi:hypothetical protein
VPAHQRGFEGERRARTWATYAPGLEAMVIRSAIVAGSAQPYNRPTTPRTDELQVASVHAEIVGLIRAVRSTPTAPQSESAPFAAVSDAPSGRPCRGPDEIGRSRVGHLVGHLNIATHGVAGLRKVHLHPHPSARRVAC